MSIESRPRLVPRAQVGIGERSSFAIVRARGGNVCVTVSSVIKPFDSEADAMAWIMKQLGPDRPTAVVTSLDGNRRTLVFGSGEVAS